MTSADAGDLSGYLVRYILRVCTDDEQNMAQITPSPGLVSAKHAQGIKTDHLVTLSELSGLGTLEN